VVKNVENVEKEIAILVKESPLFHEVTHDKRVHKFVRMIAHYKGPLGSEGTVFIDLNERAKTVLKEENHKIPHYYPENIPPFSVTTLAKKEMMAEKMAATIGRNKPRDHFDLYMILKHKHDIDLKIVAKKCKASGDEFDIVKMFNRAKKLKNRWDQDLGPLLVDRITFQEVMKVLAKHFKLKEEKEKRKI
jgi:predicted nucleotidyltransferase component of viral defense system